VAASPLLRNPINGDELCARAPSGHAVAALLISVMKSRRLMFDPKLRKWHLGGSNTYFDRGKTGIKSTAAGRG